MNLFLFLKVDVTISIFVENHTYIHYTVEHG
jgi:hypothetical protein